ncbi:PadR family transcriptional regulator [Amycolatopsis sp. NPDC059021]|uniref:PadR family transcriptional regulator n=1 Tax=Amycolatopsis sp. NPDC059021 TaxID=3346704 RepID=UPI00366B95FB
MSSARLFVLGELARRGPMHGHQIRRAAQLDHVDRWTNIKPGSLYGALQRMEAEGLVRRVRTEQAGGRPPRTVYEITEEGRHELVTQRASALREAKLSPDPIDLALGHVTGMTEEAVRSAIEDRRASLTHQHQEMSHLREEAGPYLSAMEKMIFEHTMRRLCLEIDWHNELLDRLPALMAAPPLETEE